MTTSKPPAVLVQWPPTGRTQWVGRASFDGGLSAAGWVLVDPQPERPSRATAAEAPAAAKKAPAKKAAKKRPAARR